MEGFETMLLGHPTWGLATSFSDLTIGKALCSAHSQQNQIFV